jgi:small-conductance mechanosensitive channel
MAASLYHRVVPSIDGGILSVKRFKELLLAACFALPIQFLFIGLCSQGVLAQNDQESVSAQEKQGYPVLVDGYQIYRVRQSLGAASAQERAARISAALEDLATAQDFDPGQFHTVDEDGVTTIRYGDQLITIINDAEARGTGLPRNALAQQYVRYLQEKLPIARQEHAPQYLWRAGVYAGIAVVIYVAVVWLVIAGTRWILLKVGTSATARIKGIKIQQAEIVQGARLTALLASLLRLLRVAIILIATYVLLVTAFSYFPWTRAHGQRLLAYVVNPLVSMTDAALAYLPKAVYISVILVVTHYLVRFIRVIAGQVDNGRIRFPGFYPEWVQPTYKIVRVLMYAFAAVLIYPYLPGEQSPAFKGVTVFLGVLLSLGSTSAVANFVAGIILIYTRGFRRGDWVTIGENTGEVVNQSMLATHLRTIRNEEITIPNSVVLGSFVTNFSLQAQEQGVVLHTAVTIGYDAPWRTIHKLLIDAARRTPCIVESPAPFVLQADLEDSYVKYEINAYTNQPLRMPFIYSDLHANIQDCFYEAGVEIMSPVFHALRDGNHAAMPDKYLPVDYRAKAFRVEQVEEAKDGAKRKT